MLDYNKLISDQIRNIKPSGIRRFFDLANQMEGVISLGVGEPDFKTPLRIREAGIASLQKGDTRYTANAGMAELKKEIAAYLNRKFAISYDPAEELFVTVGGSEAIDLCIRAVVNPGDEVLIVDPSFVCYAPITELAHGVPVMLPTKAEEGFKLTAETLKAAITPKSKLLILPFPSNPTGGVMHKKDLEEIAEVLKGTDILVLSDEIYGELSYSDRHVSISTLEGMKERTIVVNGFSKAFSMTGWRLGFACGPAPIISQMLKIHQYAIMCAPTTSQYAAIEALRSCDDEVEVMRNEYNQRREMMVKELNRIGLTCFAPEGAFYVFPSIKSTGMSSEAFCEGLLMAEKVAVVPGSAFGACGEGHVRISYSYAIEHLKEALVKIERYVQSLQSK